MPIKRTAPITSFWFIRENGKFIQCSKAEFDQAIRDGKSIRYNGYADKKTERIGEQLEAARMAMLTQTDLPQKVRSALTNPILVIQAEVVEVDDPLFWEKEAQQLKNQ